MILRKLEVDAHAARHAVNVAAKQAFDAIARQVEINTVVSQRLHDADPIKLQVEIRGLAVGGEDRR